MLFGAAWRSLLLIFLIILSWAIVVGIGKIGEAFFTYLVFPINITWPLWLFLFVFFGAIFHANPIEQSSESNKRRSQNSR